MQINELLNDFSCDQKRLSERKQQQKAKQDMTFSELENMFLDNSEIHEKFKGYEQKIDSDYDTIFYYESG